MSHQMFKSMKTYLYKIEQEKKSLRLFITQRSHRQKTIFIGMHMPASLRALSTPATWEHVPKGQIELGVLIALN